MNVIRQSKKEFATTSSLSQVPTHLYLTLYSTGVIVKGKVNELLQLLKTSPLFTGNALDELNVWEKKFFSDYINDLASAEENKTVSDAFCYLLDAIILKQENAQNVDQIESFENSLKDIIKHTIPYGVEVDAYINTYRDDHKSTSLVVKRKINGLLHLMKKSPLFTGETLNELNDWEDEFFSDYMNDLASDKKCDKVSKGFCYLLDDIILMQENDQNKDLIDSFEKILKDILQHTVPYGMEVDDYIDTYRDYDLQDQIMYSQMDTVNSFYQTESENLYIAHQKTEEQLALQYNLFGKKLLETKKNADIETLSVVDKLTAKIDQLYKIILMQEQAIADKIAKLQKNKSIKHLIIQPNETTDLTVKRNVTELLKQLKNSQLFTEEALKKIDDWENEFFEDYLTPLPTNKERKKVSEGLLLLLEDIIYEQGNSQTKEQIYYFEDIINEILGLTIPLGDDVDVYSRAYRAINLKDKRMQSMIALIDSFFQTRRNKLHGAAQDCVRQMAVNHTHLCERLKTIVITKKNAGIEGFSQMDELTLKIERLCNNLSLHGQTVVNTIAMNQKTEQARSITLQHCAIIIKKGKK